MANTSNLRGYLKDVANSIRNVTGSNANILANEYDLIINNFILANETSLNITPMVNAQHFGPAAGYSGYNSINVAAVDNVLEPNMTPANIVNGVNIFGVVGNYEGAAVPDGIYINENTPTKFTNQAVWIKVEDISQEPAFLDSIPSEIFSQYPGLTTFLNSLTQAQKDTINSYSNHTLMFDYNYDGSNPSVYIICTNGEWYMQSGVERSTQSIRYFSPKRKDGWSMDYISGGGTMYWQKPRYTDSSLTTVKYPANLILDTNESGIHVDVGNNRYIIYTDDTNTGFTKKIDSVGLTATANTILANKTALVGDVVLTGTMNNYGSVNITPSITTQSMNAGFYNSINISAISNTLEPNMTPENIANGVNIFGVIGNMVAGEDLNNELNAQEAIIANLQNQVNTLNAALDNAYGINGGLTVLPDGIHLAYSTCNEFPNFDMTEIISGYSMFSECYNITTTPNYNFINLINASHMFKSCNSLINIPNYCLSNVNNVYRMFQSCTNLTDIPDFYAPNINNIAEFVGYSNNLSDASVQNIINICINSNITQSWQKTLLTNTSQSPFYKTNITNDRYQNRWDDLTNAGWTY